MEENSMTDETAGVGCVACVTCASSWKPTRRELVKAAVAVTAVLALSSSVSTAQAIPGSYSDTSCEGQRDRCLAGAKSPELTDFQKSMLRVMCQAQYAACKAAEGGAAVAAALAAGVRWLDKHPEVVVGTIVVIGGIALIAATGPVGGAAIILIAL